VGTSRDEQPVWPFCFWEERSQESLLSVSQRGGKEAASAGSWLRSYSSCSSVGMAEPWTLPWDWVWGDSGAACSCGSSSCDLQSHQGCSLSCAGIADMAVGCHLGRNCSPCADSFAKHHPFCLELTTTLDQSRCPIVKLRVAAAEGRQVLDLLLSWKSMCSFIFLVVPMPQSCLGTSLAGPMPGHVAGRLQVPSAPGRLVGCMAVSLHLRYERKLFSQGVTLD